MFKPLNLKKISNVRIKKNQIATQENGSYPSQDLGFVYM